MEAAFLVRCVPPSVFCFWSCPGFDITNQWIDQPARVRQHELTTGPRLPGQLPQAETDRLHQRRKELADIVNNTRPELDRARRQLKELMSGRPDIVDKISTGTTELVDARATIARHDRPLHRRKHRATIDNAKQVTESFPRRIQNLEKDLAATDRLVPELTERIELLEALASRIPDLIDEHDDNTQLLRRDQDISPPTQESPQKLNDITTPHRPNRLLLDALNEIHTIGIDGPDHGLGI